MLSSFSTTRPRGNSRESMKEKSSLAQNIITPTSPQQSKNKKKKACRAKNNVITVVGAVPVLPQMNCSSSDNNSNQQNWKSLPQVRSPSPIVTVAVLPPKIKNSPKNKQQPYRKYGKKSVKTVRAIIMYTLLASLLFILACMGVMNLISIPSRIPVSVVQIPISNDVLEQVTSAPDLFFNPSSVQSRALSWALSPASKPKSNYMNTPATSLQRYILAVLFYTLNGPSWRVRRGWLSSSSECSWHGITCNALKEVTMIWLQDNNLIGTLPHELAYLNIVDTITFHENKITGTIPNMYCDNLVNLRQISLYDNQLTGTIPEHMYNLNMLEYVGLQNNMLHGTISKKVGGLKKLRTFYVHGNQLTGTIPTEIENSFDIAEIAVEDNRLTGTIPSRLGTLRNLRWFSVQNNKLTGQIPSTLANLPKIQVLYLYNNLFKGNAPIGICDLKTLDNYYTDCAGSFPKVTCQCCTACCSSIGCYQETALKMKEAYLKKTRKEL